MKKKYAKFVFHYEKYYRAIIGENRYSKRQFKTATQAELYSDRVHKWYKNALNNKLMEVQP